MCTRAVHGRHRETAEAFARIVKLIAIPIVEGNTSQEYTRPRLSEVFRYKRALAATVFADFEAKADLAKVVVQYVGTMA